jgi:hypothetical protein
VVLEEEVLEDVVLLLVVLDEDVELDVVLEVDEQDVEDDVVLEVDVE